MKRLCKRKLMALSLACCALALTACGKQYRAQYNQPASSAEMEIIPFTPAPPAQMPEPAAPAPTSAPELMATQTATTTETKAESKTETQTVASGKTDSSPVTQPAPESKDSDEAKKLGPVTPNNPFSYLALFTMPAYSSNWGLGEEMYEKVKKYYADNRQRIHNPDYVIIVDFNKPSSEKRFFIFDLRKSRLIKLLTTHGKNSDPLNTGYATLFSNTEDSLQSSLGFFLTLQSYEGSNGYSLRIRGLEATNSNAEKRGVVIHSAPYVDEEKGYAGRTWGCLALDPKISRSVIDHIRGGALLFIGK